MVLGSLFRPEIEHVLDSSLFLLFIVCIPHVYVKKHQSVIEAEIPQVLFSPWGTGCLIFHVHLTSYTLLYLPLPPSFLRTASDQKMEVETARE